MVTRATILEHVIEPERGTLAPDLANYLLSLDFPAADKDRYDTLVERAQNTTLNEEEQAELNDYLNVNDFLTIVQAKARSSLSDGGKSEPDR